MAQPWKQWTWKQRTVFAGVVSLIGLVLSVLNLTADTPIAKFTVFVVIVGLGLPSLYVLISASNAADRRHAEGNMAAYSPRVRKAMERREAKKGNDG